MAIIPFLSSSNIWARGTFEEPWDSARPSIYSTLAAVEGALEGFRLPDEEQRIDSDGLALKFAPGALDGIMGVGDENALETAALTFGSLKKVLSKPTAANVAVFYDNVNDQSVLSHIDDLSELIVGDPNIDQERLRIFARWLAMNAPDREPVKAAIAILGLYDGSNDEKLFLNLGRHDEFTLYATVALINSSPSPEETLWQLARDVHGWGRIHTVERLAGTENEEIKKWLVRDGYSNDVMDEYLAYLAATTGELDRQLASNPTDPALLDGA